MEGKINMRPAFSSTRQAAAFAIMLLGILLLPVILRKSWLPSSRENYLWQGWDTFGNQPQLYHQIFEEKGDIDIAFVGSSRIWLGIDTAFVQEQLSKQLGRPVVVRTIAWGWSGFDKLFFAMRDLLQNRRIHMLVFNDEGQDVNLMDPLARRWFRLGDEDAELMGFPIRLQSDYYFAAIQGIPRNLLELLRPNLPCEFSPATRARLEESLFCSDSQHSLGSLALLQGFSKAPVFSTGHPPFESFSPPNSTSAADAVIYSTATKDAFQFIGPQMLAPQTHYAQKFSALARSKSIQMVMLHVPEVADLNRVAITEREFWPDSLHADVTLLGILPQRMFTGLSEEEKLKFFADPYHLNQNGQQYFTKLITPTLSKLYENSTNR
jgi:hypothetical protein